MFAAEEERFSRTKHDRRFPIESVKAALRYAHLDFRELDAVAFGHNHAPGYLIQDLRALLSGKIRFTPSNLVFPFVFTAIQLYFDNGRRPLRTGFDGAASVKMVDIDHHLAHAWSAHALSGFDESLVIVMDARGARQATTLYHAHGERLEPIRTLNFPNSLGFYYAAFTDLLGFQRYADEWKVMGLAAYGEPGHDLHDVIKTSQSGYRFNGRYLGSPYLTDSSRLAKRYGRRRDPEQLTQDDKNLASSVQSALEEAVVNLVREGVRRTNCRRLALAGGVALNSRANGRILESGLVDDLFIQPAAADDGTAVGAALGAFSNLGQPIPRHKLNDVYLGPEFSREEIAAALDTYKIPRVEVENVEQVTAGLLADGMIVGWFQGRMEFGPRALGNRSILADPRRAEMKDLVNESIKFREAWRPFAPSCLAEVADEYFEGSRDAPFMILTFNVRPEKRGVIPAVTHVDHTSRIQTVTKESNFRYWRLINEFGKLTGVPVIMNTSFNLRGEPIVCTPQDALRTFYSSGLDFLVLDDFVVAKDPSWMHERD